MDPRRCQHCLSLLNVGEETLDQDMSCPTCGSRVTLSPQTVGQYRPTGARIQDFEMQGEVGRGQFGSVWRAIDRHLRRTVALKIPRREDLHPHTRNMFLREGKAAALLKHENIVPVYEVFEEEGQIYIASEFIDGDDLKISLAGGEFSTQAAVVEFMIQTAEALDYAHSRGVIHRDLKPGNILVDAQGQPHITDFGLAKIESFDSTLTVNGDLPVGTMAYMSPEQAAGEVHGLDCRSDVFSLGSIFYEMLTRQRPFPGVSFDILEKVCEANPVRPRHHKPDLPPRLEAICLKAMARNREDRYQTAGEFADDLRRFVIGEPTVARPITRATVARNWLRKNLTFAAVCLVALSSTAAAALALFQAPATTLPVKITTVPAGARLAVFPLDPETAKPIDDKVIHTGRTPLTLRLAPADYLIVAKLDDGRFHEVYRHVPDEPTRTAEVYPHRRWHVDDRGRIQLPAIGIPALDVCKNMAALSGSEGRSPATVHPGQSLTKEYVAPFHLDTREVTVDEFRKVYYDHMAGLGVINAPGDHPMTGTLFDYAVWYAEQVGKRLPLESEYEFAATNGGKTQYPWGDDPQPIPWELAAVESLEFDKTATQPPIYGLFSNGAEFTASPYVPQLPFNSPPGRPGLTSYVFDNVTIRGAVYAQRADIASILRTDGIGVRSGMPRRQLSDNVGFRCARSQTPRW